MRTVDIAQLHDGLSRYLQEVSAGEEIIVSDGSVPVARLSPYLPESAAQRDARLIAQGIMLPAEREMDWDYFFSIGAGEPQSTLDPEVLLQAVVDSRGDW